MFSFIRQLVPPAPKACAETTSFQLLELTHTLTCLEYTVLADNQFHPAVEELTEEEATEKKSSRTGRKARLAICTAIIGIAAGVHYVRSRLEMQKERVAKELHEAEVQQKKSDAAKVVRKITGVYSPSQLFTIEKALRKIGSIRFNVNDLIAISNAHKTPYRYDDLEYCRKRIGEAKEALHEIRSISPAGIEVDKRGLEVYRDELSDAIQVTGKVTSSLDSDIGRIKHALTFIESKLPDEDKPAGKNLLKVLLKHIDELDTSVIRSTHQALRGTRTKLL